MIVSKSLLQQIKHDSLEARKAGEKAKGILLTTLYAEAAAIGKNNGNRESTDDETTKVIRKFLAGVDESITVAARAGAIAPLPLIKEKETLQSYLPPELTDQNIQEALTYARAFRPLSMKDMPVLKGFIDEKWPNAYDGKRVSEALKKAINDLNAI